MWGVTVANLTRTPAGWAPYRGLKVTRRLNGPMGISFAGDADDESMAAIEVASSAILAHQDGVLRFKGKVDDPLEDTEELITVVAKDALGWLEHRRIAAAVTYTAQDAGAIAMALITAQNARVVNGVTCTTRIMSGTIQASRQRDRSYELGKPVVEAIKQLAEVDDGFWYYANPYDDNSKPDMHATFEVRWPTSGTDNVLAKFEFGEETISNLVGFKRIHSRPLTGVRTTGEGDAETRLTSYAAASAVDLQAYDLLEDEVAFSNVSEQATLDQHALGLLRPAPGSIYQVTPAGSGSGLNEIASPRLFVDFDVGDICRLTIHHGRIQESDLRIRILEATIDVADDATDEETLSSLLFEVV